MSSIALVGRRSGSGRLTPPFPASRRELDDVPHLRPACSVVVLDAETIPRLGTARITEALDRYGGAVLVATDRDRLDEVGPLASAIGARAVDGAVLGSTAKALARRRWLQRLPVARWLASRWRDVSEADRTALRSLSRLDVLDARSWAGVGHLSRRRVDRCARRVTGLTAGGAARAYRLDTARWLLTSGFAVEVVARAVSYSCRQALERALLADRGRRERAAP